MTTMSKSIVATTQAVGISLAPGDREIVQAILYSQNHSASAVQLKALLRLRSIVQANAAIGRLGKKIYQNLGAHPDGRRAGTFQWWTVAAKGYKDKRLGFIWCLRPGVVQGLVNAGYSANRAALADEVEARGLHEGSFKRITVNPYKRNPVARARCIAAHGASCAVCGFDFGRTYGPEAEGFIHVHHLVPLSAISENYEVDPVADLRPMCPNCHAVIHMSNPPRTIAQAKALIGA